MKRFFVFAGVAVLIGFNAGAQVFKLKPTVQVPSVVMPTTDLGNSTSLVVNPLIATSYKAAPTNNFEISLQGTLDAAVEYNILIDVYDSAGGKLVTNATGTAFGALGTPWTMKAGTNRLALRTSGGITTLENNRDAAVAETDVSFTDVTTGNASTTKHGYMPKLSGNASDVFKGDGSQGPISSSGAGGSDAQTITLHDDFMFFRASTSASGYAWVEDSNAGGTVTAGDSTAANPGQVVIGITADASSRASLWAPTQNTILFGGGTYSNECVVKISALSDATDTYTLRLAFLDARPDIDSDDAVCWRYTHGVNGGNWQGVARSNGSESVLNTSTAPSTSFQKLGILINAAGTLVTFYINGTSVGTINSNIPTGAGRYTGTGGFGITRTAGSTNARTLTVDYYRTVITLTAIR